MLLLVAALLVGLWSVGALTALAVCRVAARADALDRAAAYRPAAPAAPRPRELVFE